MKLLGFRRFKGERNGRSYDFVQLVIDKEEESSNNSGGVQLVMRNRNGIYSLPSVSGEIWDNAVKSGVRIGGSVDLSFDYENKPRFGPAVSPFTDIV